MKNFINHIFQIQFQQFLRLSFMVTCQSSELDWEVTVELPADFLSLERGFVNWAPGCRGLPEPLSSAN